MYAGEIIASSLASHKFCCVFMKANDESLIAYMFVQASDLVQWWHHLALDIVWPQRLFLTGPKDYGVGSNGTTRFSAKYGLGNTSRPLARGIFTTITAEEALVTGYMDAWVW